MLASVYTIQASAKELCLLTNLLCSRADTGDESLIELSFMYQNGIYTPDIDVSYV